MRSAAWNELKLITLKLQVRETFSCTIVRESAAELFFFLAPEDMQVGQGLLKHEIFWFLGVGV